MSEPVPGAVFYDQTLPDVVAALDGQVPYWPGSPYGGDDYNSVDDGDRHNWNVWHGGIDRALRGRRRARTIRPEGVSYRRYAEDLGRFISEFGMHAAPVLETLRRNHPGRTSSTTTARRWIITTRTTPRTRATT